MTDEEIDKVTEETAEEANSRRLLLKEVLDPELNEKINLKMRELGAAVGNRLVERVKESWRTNPIKEDIEGAGEEVEEDDVQWILTGSLEESQLCLTSKLAEKYTDPVLLKTWPHQLIFEAEEGCFLAKFRFNEAGRPLIEIEEELEIEYRFLKKGSKEAVAEQKRDEVEKMRRMAGLPPKPEKPSEPLNESKLTSEERHARVLAGLAVYDDDGTNMLVG